MLVRLEDLTFDGATNTLELFPSHVGSIRRIDTVLAPESVAMFPSHVGSIRSRDPAEGTRLHRMFPSHVGSIRRVEGGPVEVEHEGFHPMLVRLEAFSSSQVGPL
jgi:hypothetical protein